MENIIKRETKKPIQTTLIFIQKIHFERNVFLTKLSNVFLLNM